MQPRRETRCLFPFADLFGRHGWALRIALVLCIPCTVLQLAPDSAVVAQEGTSSGGKPVTLTIVLTGLASDEGTAALALYDTRAAYEALAEPLRKARLEIEDRRCTWTVEGLPPGDYAVTAYHDRDDDGELDKGAFGIPTEPYGFSNGARGKLGPPAWSAVRLALAADARVEVPLR